MTIICDFHLHSKFSRATSKNMTLEKIDETCLEKGIDVVGTSDFLHPEWQSEILNKLTETKEGLFCLNNSQNNTKFILSTEISSIYKKYGKVRKIHNLVIMPSIKSVIKLSKELDKIGNIKSDGRPILGLDAKKLIEIVLEIDESSIFIPAHIWTPWFSLFGDRSGFDDIEECFEEFSNNIFALETGLSSDPPMNWRWSKLDRFTLVSNSDAHSPSKIGREANIIDADLNFNSIRDALKDKKKVATIEFFPEEGKYHFDGHRKCNVVISPEEAIKLNNFCPVCGKPLTIGVFHRILECCDRDIVEKKLQEYISFIPLEEILSQILGVGVKSKKVKRFYNKLINEFGNEIRILKDVDCRDLSEFAGLILEIAISKMRSNNISIQPGYDGEYGKVTVINKRDRDKYELKQEMIK